MSRRAVFWLVRFAAIYAALAAFAAVAPVYRELERPLAWAANLLLRQTGGARTLSLERRGDETVYLYELHGDDRVSRLERPLHAHGFVLLLYGALVASTPWLGARRFAAATAGGLALVGGIALLMLMSDVASWDPSAYSVPLGFVAGLHQTAAAGVIPIAYWALVAFRPAAPRGG
ncbi:MAG TPA: hypothetical protein VMR31_18675 [Myxococcota bacterium]|nr:hypothetical protein [Myxococcota bacterium]